MVRLSCPLIYADYRPSFREKEANDGWKRLLAWFERHGVK
jgi:carboxymethylenebutenolidase